MWYLTDRQKKSLRASNQTTAGEVHILVDGVVELQIVDKTIIDTSTGDATGLVDGSVSVERATVRRNASIVLADVSDRLTRSDVDELIVPIVSEFRLYRGLYYHDRKFTDVYPNDRWTVPVGTFVVTKIVNQWPKVTVYGFDRMWLFNEYRFTDELSIVSGQPITDLIVEQLTARFPGNRLSYNIPHLDYKTPRLIWDAQDNPGEKLHDLAESIGLMLYTDQMGTFVTQPEPSVDTNEPVWSYVNEAGGSLLPWPSEERSGENAYNWVVVSGESIDGFPPVRGEAGNTDPTSSLYFERVGKIVKFSTSPIYQSTAQARLGAATILKKQGLADTITLSGTVNPALETADCLFVAAPHPANLSTRVLADSFQVPMRGIGPQQIVCRSKVGFL